MNLEYRILGPLEVRRDGQPVDLGGTKQRTLLAVLLLRANQSVSTDQIIDELWGATPPKGARDTVRAYVRRLHRTLRGTGNQSPPETKLLHGDAFGYRLSVPQGQLDLHRFDNLAAQAKRSLLAGDAVRARALLHNSLALWRGLPLADVASDSLRTAVTARLTENRLAALEDRIEAELELQHHTELIGELDELVRTYPTRERFCAQLMLALYRAGRQVDALDTYRRRKNLLAEEYGCDPSTTLQQLEHAILTNDPALNSPPVRETREPAVNRVPHQLPPDINDFTGRTDVLNRLVQNFTPEGATAPIAAIAGQPGVGKSTFALHLARHLSGTHYPDGQLYANLRGQGSDRKDPFHVLAQFLRGLGVDEASIPGSLDEREQLFRTLLAGRRVLVVLDNVPDESAVRPLLPGDPGCGAILTSRRRLAGLESVRCEHLPVFTEEESLLLLESLVGSERLAREHAAAHAIVERCGNLPLALRIAGARLAAKPHWPLSRLAAKLDNPEQRLDELVIGDVDVRSSISPSYQLLTRTEQAALRVFASLPFPDMPMWVAAVALGVPHADAEDLLERLADEQLLEVVSPDRFGQVRYRLPGLTRDVVLGYGENPQSENSRVFETYLALSTCASQALHGHSTPTATAEDVDPTTAESIRTDPISWFQAETPCVLSAIRHLPETMPRLCWRLAVALFEFLRLHNRWKALGDTFELALRAAQESGESDGETRILHALGIIHATRDEVNKALEYYTAGLTLSRESREPHLEARLLLDLGHAELARGQCDAAERRFHEALPLMRELGENSGESAALAGLAQVHRFRGRLRDAIRHVHYSLLIDGDHHSQANRLLDLAMTVRDLGIFHPQPDALADSAVRCFRQAARLFRIVGDKRNEMYALTGVAGCRTEQGRPQEARALGEHALAVFQEIGYADGETLARRVLGMAHLSEGNAEAAIETLRDSLRSEQVLDEPSSPESGHSTMSRLPGEGAHPGLRQQGRSLYHLGVAFNSLGRSAEAAHCCRRSAEIARKLGPVHWTIPPLRMLAELDAEHGERNRTGRISDEIRRINAVIELPSGCGDSGECARNSGDCVTGAVRSPPGHAALFS